jgi:transcription initiation factor IIE alpha subunit
MHRGYIPLFRKIRDWEGYSDPVISRVFIEILLTANFKPKKLTNITVGRGQLLTSRMQLSENLKISQSKIRRALKYLKSTNNITIKTTNRYSLITIVNYDSYNNIRDEYDQQNDQHSGQQTDSRRTADGQPTATTNNVKNINNVKKEKNNPKKETSLRHSANDSEMHDSSSASKNSVAHPNDELSNETTKQSETASANRNSNNSSQHSANSKKTTSQQKIASQQEIINTTEIDCDVSIRGGADDYNRIFESWWSDYPKKIGKKASRTIFIRLLKKGETTEKQLFESLKNYKRTKQWQNRDYIPHPTTWLNQGRYDDEIQSENISAEHATTIELISGWGN